MASGKQALLAWCKSSTADYPDVEVRNFTSSWADGLAWCALINRFSPESLDYHQHCSKSNPKGNLTIAFAAATKLGIPQLLDVDDLLTAAPDALSVITYTSFYYNKFHLGASATTRGLSKMRQENSENVDSNRKNVPYHTQGGHNVRPRPQNIRGTPEIVRSTHQANVAPNFVKTTQNTRATPHIENLSAFERGRRIFQQSNDENVSPEANISSFERSRRVFEESDADNVPLLEQSGDVHEKKREKGFCQCCCIL